MITIKMRFGSGSSAVFRTHRYNETKHVSDALRKSIKRIGGMDMQACTGIMINVSKSAALTSGVSEAKKEK